ncbi:MAG: TIGR04255 family protein [Phycisphaerae bacterium]|nr:TIGR04255 family protein [Phycisphaerae bacterium]
MSEKRRDSFRNPPVIETVLGIQFNPIRGLTNAHLGAYWKSLGPEWPEVEDSPILGEQFEEFGERKFFPGAINLKFSQEPHCRLRIQNKDHSRMIQVQNSRFHYNWLGLSGEKYPRYREVRPEFDKKLLEFQEFLTDSGFDALEPNQWEITYVNHIKRGTVWETPEDWSRIFTRFPVPFTTTDDQIQLANPSGNWRFEIVPQKGRLHVELQRGHLGSPDSEEAFVLKLTARGPLDQELSIVDAIDSGLNLGHSAIVDAFCDFTTEEAHHYWSRES